MKVKLFASIIISTMMFFIGCNEDSITEAVLGSNSLTVSGSISKSFDAITIGGLAIEDSISVFTVIMRPKSADSYNSDIFALAKLSDIIPPIGKYNIIDFTDARNSTGFISSYSANDSTIYLMNAGTIEITESSALKVAGTFDVSGVLLDFNVTSPKEIAIKGKFSTIPINMN